MLTDLRKAMHACAIADDARVPVELVDRVLREFERHAATYDAAYAERLAAVGRLHAACEISSRGLGFGMHEILETVAERIESRLAWAPQRRTEG
jgi:hypothetical protein